MLLDVVSDMRSLTDRLQAVADGMAGNEPAPKKKEVTLEEVRGILAEKSQAGLTAEVRDMIKKYGGTILSEVAPEHYADLLKEAQGLCNE